MHVQDYSSCSTTLVIQRRQDLNFYTDCELYSHAAAVPFQKLFSLENGLKNPIKNNNATSILFHSIKQTANICPPIFVQKQSSVIIREFNILPMPTRRAFRIPLVPEGLETNLDARILKYYYLGPKMYKILSCSKLNCF